MSLEGDSLLSKSSAGGTSLLVKIFIGLLVLAVAGLTVGLIVVGTRKPPAPTNNNFPDYETCPYYNELNNLAAQTHGMYRENRNRTLSFFNGYPNGSIIFLLGATDIGRNGDVSFVFRQSSNVLYLSGCDMTDIYVVIDPVSTNATLFVPRRATDYAVWNGAILTNDQIREKYDVDQVMYTFEMSDYFEQLAITKIYTLSGTTVPVNPANYTFDYVTIGSALNQARRVKSEKELQVLKFVNQVSSNAHQYVMQKSATKLRNSQPVWEYDLESFFLYLSYNCMARLQAYTSIVGSGPSSAILHYIANDQQVENSDIILIDAGAELWGYGSDITRTFPATGKFTDQQKELYQMVYNAQQSAVSILKEGVTWSQLNNITRYTITNELLQAGFLQGNFSDLWTNNVVRYFFPHGVGHSLGLDVHDPEFPSNSPILSNAFLTIEPGIYFNQALLDTAFSNPDIAPFLVTDKVNTFIKIGGVRIEDDYIVTVDGSIRVTSAANQDEIVMTIPEYNISEDLG